MMVDYVATNVGDPASLDVLALFGLYWSGNVASSTACLTLLDVVEHYGGLFRRLADA